MSDATDKVIPHPAMHRQRSGGGQNSESARRRSQERADAVAALASQIREHVSGFRGRLDHDTRLQLASQLGQMLYASPTPKRGSLTQILVDAGVSKPEEHTKRLPRHAIKPRKKLPSPKALAAMPDPYLRIAEAMADARGLDRDAVVVDLFADTSIGSRDDSARTSDELEHYLPLYRLLYALAEAAGREAEVASYFRDFARWRWITAADARLRGSNVASFGLAGVTINEIPGQSGTEDASPIPALSLVWLPDRNTFEADPEDPEFYGQRVRLLPRVELFTDLGRHIFDLEPSAPVERFLDGDGHTVFPEVELVAARVHLNEKVWLVLCPSGPQGEVRPHLARFYEQRTVGVCIVDGERQDFEHVTAPPAADVIYSGDGSQSRDRRVYVGFAPLDGVHLTASAVVDDDELEAVLVPPTESPLTPLTPVSVSRVLGYPMDLGGDEHDDISAFTFAPFRTRAAFVESNFRQPGLVWEGDREMKRALIEDAIALRERIDGEIQLLREQAYRNQEEVMARLATPLSNPAEGETE